MGEGRVQVFVSHSSHEPAALARLEDLVKFLGTGDNPVEVLFDKKEITAGSQWRKLINAMLAECDAAVIREDRATESSEVPGGGAQLNFARVLDFSFEALAARQPAAQQLMRILACYAPDGIPRVIIGGGSRAADSAALDEALAALSEYGLIALGPQTVSMHRLV